MKKDKRPCIAIIGASILNKRSFSAVYGFTECKHFQIQVSYNENDYISAFDYSRGNYVSGTVPSLYDYATSTFYSITRSGNQLTGFDYESGKFFSIIVNGVNVSLYDYETALWYQYSVS